MVIYRVWRRFGYIQSVETVWLYTECGDGLVIYRVWRRLSGIQGVETVKWYTGCGDG